MVSRLFFCTDESLTRYLLPDIYFECQNKQTKTQTQVQTQLVIKPEFAMALRTEETKERSVLSIGGPSTADWVLNLEEHVTTIHREHPGRDLYLVGYRDEERPNLFDAHKRTSVPFFAVHTLEAGSHAPKTLVVTDGLTKTEERQSIAVSPFKWVQLHTFSTGETVHMLQFIGRTTKHSTKDQSGMTCGGQVFFPQRFDSKQNPGDSFEITLDGEVYYFDSEVWDHAKRGLKQALKQSPFENWLDCCCRAKKAEILSIAVSSALEAFFLVYDDLDRTVHEDTVKKGLSEMFWQFKKEVADSEKLYKQMEAIGETAEQAIHFKIYPRKRRADGIGNARSRKGRDSE